MENSERQEKIDLILEHYEDPQNYGKINRPDIVQSGGNPDCGDIITIYIKIGDDNTINEISFEGKGCTISQAAASMITDIVIGKNIEEIELLPGSVVLDILGKELAMTRPRCSMLALDTIKMAVREYKRKKILETINQDW